MQEPERSSMLTESLAEYGLERLPVARERSAFERAAKRALDVVGASIGLVLSLPFLALVSVAIQVDSRGPAIFRQKRVGENMRNGHAGGRPDADFAVHRNGSRRKKDIGGRPFTFYKFRSMVNDAEAQQEGLMTFNEATGPIFKMKDDPRITRVGRWLRRTSLDELPQLMNVIRGDMSLVGPRPPLPQEVEEYDADERRRLAVRPGMTGLWQVHGRSELDFSEMVRLDLEYIENWSVWLDLKMIAKTMGAVLSRRGAY